MIADNGRKYSPLICALDVSVPKAERHNFLLEIIVFFMCDMRCAVSNYVHFFKLYFYPPLLFATVIHSIGCVVLLRV